MFFILSLFLPILTGVGVFLLIFLNNLPWWLALILGILAAALCLCIICVIIILALHFRGKYFKEHPDYLEKKRWRLMNDASRFSCFWLGLSIKKVGLEKLPKGENVIFYSNHMHFSDIIVYDLVLKDYPRGSMFKKEFEHNFIFGDMAVGLGGVSVDRSNDRSAAMSVIEIIKRVKNGSSFMIYPEGTRNKEGIIGAYHPGSFKVAMKTEKPIVVMYIDYSKKISPSMPFLPTKVYVEVVDVLYYDDYKDIPTVELAEKVHNMAMETMNKRREEIKYLR